jgi:hypothetical protein
MTLNDHYNVIHIHHPSMIDSTNLGASITTRLTNHPTLMLHLLHFFGRKAPHASPKTSHHPPQSTIRSPSTSPRKLAVAGTRKGVQLIPATLRRCFRWGGMTANASLGVTCGDWYARRTTPSTDRTPMVCGTSTQVVMLSGP